MGPRLMSRGGRIRSAGELRLIEASMGPRLMSRGGAIPLLYGVGLSRFNGAAAHEPRRQQ